jgi:hypothetical protein
MSLFEKDFEGTIFESLRTSPLYVGFDDTDCAYTKGSGAPLASRATGTNCHFPLTLRYCLRFTG